MRDIFVVIATVLVAAAAPRSDAASEHQQTEYKFEIPQQALSQALIALADVVDSDFGYFPESREEEAMLVGPIEGTYTADAALELMLEPIGFTHEWMSEESFRVFRKGTESKDAAAVSDKEGSSASLKRRWPGGKRQYDDVDFVIVIGTRISSLETEAQSVAVINQPKIDSYGASTGGELFDYVPQVPFIRAEHTRVTGEQFADLRGFGNGTTMVLINGRRMGGTATSFDTGGFDINTIPLTAVQQIEVLPDAPPLAIGTDAIGGVINFVLKNEISQPTVEVRYGAADGGAEERRLSMGIGTTRDAFRATGTFDVFQRSPLFGSQREPIRNQDYRRFGGSDYRSPNANPGNVSSITNQNLPGLDSPHAAIPVGSSGIDLHPQDFTSTGLLNRNLASLGRSNSIVLKNSRLGLTGSAELELSPSFIAFGEIFGTTRSLEREVGPPVLSGTVVPASNAFNPFGEPVAVNTLLEGAPIQTWSTDAELFRAVAGMRGAWREWEGEIAMTWMKDQANVSRPYDLDLTRLSHALASSDPNTALNVFRDGPAGTNSLMASLVGNTQTRKYSSTSTQGHAQIEGPLFALPAGDTRLMLGGEHRVDEVANKLLSADPQRTVSAAFAEIYVPLIDSEMNIPGIRRLATSLGARTDHYSDLGSRNTPQYGIVWQPSADLKIRASYSESYRPPLMWETFTPRVSGRFTYPDPRRGNTPSSFVVTYAGNSDLEPIKGRTWTAGADLAPLAIPQLQASIGYWHTRLADRIMSLSWVDVLAHEELFPGRIIRAEPTPEDRETLTPGALASIDHSWGNFGQLTASGIDLNLAHTSDTSVGRFTFNVASTWNLEYRTVLVPGASSKNEVGTANTSGTIPRWRAVASALWTRGAFSTFASGQFVSPYKDVFIGGTLTGRTIPATVVFDAQASVRVGEFFPSISLLSAVDFTAGVKNALDKPAHFSEIGWDYGYDPSQGDLRQRFWYLRLEKQF